MLMFTLQQIVSYRFALSERRRHNNAVRRVRIGRMHKQRVMQFHIFLLEVPHQFIALCEASGTSPQAALRGMAAMVCGLQYDEDNRLVPMEDAAA